jgi:hypothetical protein
LFAARPKPKKIVDVDEAIRRYIRKKHARD